MAFVGTNRVNGKTPPSGKTIFGLFLFIGVSTIGQISPVVVQERLVRLSRGDSRT